MSDDEDDSMAANPEPARVEAAYGDVRGPRRDREREPRGKWTITFVPEHSRAADLPAGGIKECRDCKEKVQILHAVGNDMQRVVCGKCAGEFNRRRMGDRAPRSDF